MRPTILAVAAIVALCAMAGPSFAEKPADQCRDAKGRVMQCRVIPVKVRHVGQCRDKAGLEVPCGPSAVANLEGVPLGTTAQCGDGTYSTKHTPGGRCIGHGGVATAK